MKAYLHKAKVVTVATLTIGAFTACGAKVRQEAAPEAGIKTELKQLNTLSALRTNGLSIHFDRIDSAMEVQPQLGIACQKNHPCPTVPSFVRISGNGELRQNGEMIATIFGLSLVVSYSADIANGQNCSKTAGQAFHDGHQLDIDAIGTIMPIVISGSSGSVTGSVGSSGTVTVPPGSPATSESIEQTAAAIVNLIAPPPIFESLAIGVALSQISACSEGGASVEPTPLPEEPQSPAPGQASQTAKN